MFDTRADLSREMLKVLNGVLESKLESERATVQRMERTAPKVEVLRVSSRAANSNGGEALQGP
jgi:hypothetical protein